MKESYCMTVWLTVWPYDRHYDCMTDIMADSMTVWPTFWIRLRLRLRLGLRSGLGLELRLRNVDFRTGSHPHQHMVINGGNIEIVAEYKYLGTIIDNKLQWTCNTDTIYKKGLQRLHFMRKLKQFRVDRDMMSLFYHSFVESILLFGSVAWYFSLSVTN